MTSINAMIATFGKALNRPDYIVAEPVTRSVIVPTRLAIVETAPANDMLRDARFIAANVVEDEGGQMSRRMAQQIRAGMHDDINEVLIALAALKFAKEVA